MIRLSCKSKVFALKFKKALETVIHKKAWMWQGKPRTVVWQRPTSQGIKTYVLHSALFEVVAHCKRWYYILKRITEVVKLGMLPIQDSDFVKGLVRGFYDAEGCLFIKKYSYRMVHHLLITNSNVSILKLLMALFKKEGVKSYLRIYRNHTPWIEIQRRDDINKLKSLGLVGVKV